MIPRPESVFNDWIVLSENWKIMIKLSTILQKIMHHGEGLLCTVTRVCRRLDTIDSFLWEITHFYPVKGSKRDNRFPSVLSTIRYLYYKEQ